MYLERGGGWEEVGVRGHAGPSTQSLGHHREVCVDFILRARKSRHLNYVFRSEEMKL